MDLWGEILLSVEGIDEVNFFITYIHHLMGKNPELWKNLSKVQVISIDGKAKFKEQFRALSLQTAFRDVVRIGIIQDADDDSDRAFRSLCSKLNNLGYKHPTRQLSCSDEEPSFVILINPSDRKGMIEDIIFDSFSGVPSIKCVNNFHKCLEEIDNFPLPKNKSKARLQTLLSSQTKYAKDIGVAARQGIIPFDHPAFDNYIEFFKLLIGDLKISN